MTLRPPLDINQLEADRQRVNSLTDQFYRDNKLSWRVKTIINQNPYMANNVDAVMQMAQMPIDDNELFSNSGAMYGMQSTDLLAKQLSRYSPSVQRSIFYTLTPAQQQNLRQMGFEPSSSDVSDGNIIERIAGTALEAVGGAAKFVIGGVGRKVMPVIGPGLNLLDEASDFIVGRPYRTIRQLDGVGQLSATLGGILGAVGMLTAPVTGGASLGLVGLAALAGGAAGSLAEQAFIGNADDWFSAWSRAGNGERLFTNGGVRRATEILGDPKLVNMAKLVAENLDEDTTLLDLAQQVAGTERSTDPKAQNKQLVAIAKTFAQEGTPAYQKVYAGLNELIANPLFQDAVKQLEQSKISIGRDIANLLPIDKDSGTYRVISGGIDAATVLLIDPFMVAGRVAREVNMVRKGIRDLDGANAAAQFLKLSMRPEIVRKHEAFVEAINTGSTILAKRFASDLMPVWNEFLGFVRTDPEIAGRLATADDFVNWVVGSNQMKSLMQGVGFHQGVSYGMLKGVNKFQYAMRSGKGALADFMQGAADMGLERVLSKISKNPAALGELIDRLPSEWVTHLAGVADDVAPEIMSKIVGDGAPDTLAKLVRESAGLDNAAYEMGRKYSKLPGVKTMGTLYTNMTTLSPRGTLIMLDATKPDSVGDIDAFIDLFSSVGVPSYVREIWKRAIYQSPDVNTRMNLLVGLIDSAATATGMRALKDGNQLIDDFVRHVGKEYGIGGLGRANLELGNSVVLEDVPVGLLPDADGAIMMQIPDMKTMRKAVRQGTLLRTLVGVSDSVAVNAFQNKYWKPAVLLRFGFFVKNATEDILSYIARAGIGHMTQEFAARAIAQENVHLAALKSVTPGTIQEGFRLGVPLNQPLLGKLDNLLEPAERNILSQNYLVPRHLKPVLKIVERFGQEGSPAIEHMANYGTWLRGHLRRGFAREGADAGHLGSAWFRYQELGQRLGARGSAGLARAAETTGMAKIAARVEGNFFANLELLAYGSKYSTRRMLAGGVNSDLISGAEAFESRFLPAIMQRVGASSQLPWTIDNAGDQIVERFIDDANGGQTVQYARVAGERAFVRPDTKSTLVEEYHESIFKTISRLTDDAPSTRILQEVAKVYGPEMRALIPEEDLLRILQEWQKTGRGLTNNGQDQVVRFALMLNEANVNPQRIHAFLDNSVVLGAERRISDTEVKLIDHFRDDLVQMYPGLSVPTPEEFANLYRTKVTAAKSEVRIFQQTVDETIADLSKAKSSDVRAELRDALRNAQADLRQAKLVVDELTAIEPGINLMLMLDSIESPVARGWVLQNLAWDAYTRGYHFSGLGGYNEYANMLKNWQRTMTSPDFPVTETPFYNSAEEAYRSGKRMLIDEINQGQYDSVIALGRDTTPGAQGSKFYQMKVSSSIRGKVTNEILISEGLLDSFGQTNIPNIAAMFKVDFAALSQAQREEFVHFANNLVDTLRTGDPLFVSSQPIADRLQGIVSDIHRKHFGLVAPQYKTAWLPVADPEGFTAVYPELAQRTSLIKSGLDPNVGISSVAWDKNIYPTPDVFLEEVQKYTYPELMVESVVKNIEQNIRGGRRAKLVVRDNAEVYVRVNGKPVQLPPGTYIDGHSEIYPTKELDTPITVETNAFLKSQEVTFEGNTEIMWNILNPILLDKAEEVGGAPVRAVKSWKTVRAPKAYARLGYEPGAQVELPADVIRMRAARVQDVVDSPAGVLPDFAIAQMYEPIVESSWKKAINYGFNRVISPMLDAVARRPAAFHSFVMAHQRNLQAVQWLFRGSSEEQEVNGIISRLTNDVKFKDIPDEVMPRFVDAGRALGRTYGLQDVEYWSDEQILAFVRSMSDEEIAGASVALQTAVSNGRLNMKPAEAKALGSFVESNIDMLKTRSFSKEANAWNFIDRIDGLFGNGTALSGGFIPDRGLYHLLAGKAMSPNSAQQRMWNALSKEDWKVIQRAALARNRAYEQAGEYAAEYAIRDIMPYIDTHEIRSQFSDWARGYLPFWYAEENFLKRWARIFTLEGPAGSLARARKLQLTANGLKTMGIVREDPNGNSYFVYPGSELLSEVIGKIPGLNLLPVNVLFQTPADKMIPGFNPQFGAPGFSPIVALPVEFATMLFPESSKVKNFQRNVMGDLSVDSNVLDMILPSQVANTFKAIYEFVDPYNSTGSERIQSAMITAMAHLDANGHGLPDDATPDQVDEYLRDVRNHARIVVLSQAIAGWFTPGPAMALQLPEGEGSSLSWLTSGQVDNPAEIFSSTYYELIRNLGIEEGTQAYLERFPKATVMDVLEPMAYTVARTESVSGAPLPRTEDGLAFYQENKDVLEQYKYAGPWLLPQDQLTNGKQSQYAYDTGMIDGLRKSKTPEEFLKELKFREASTIYFDARKSYLDEYENLRTQKKPAAMQRLRAYWDGFAQYWKATHPVFAEMLVSSDARQRRANVIEEMRYVLNDPNAPRASHFSAMKTLMDSYDAFVVERSKLNLNKTARARAKVEILKKQFEDWVTGFTQENPMVNSFWLTVLRPESGLD